MRTFACLCGNTIFFKNTRCIRCKRRAAYLPDQGCMVAIERAKAGGNLWRAPNGALYRRCENYAKYDICNWMVPAGESHAQCWSCRLTEKRPPLSNTRQQVYTYRLEAAKRHMLYSLYQLGLPVRGKQHDPDWGLSFRFETDRDPDTEFAHLVDGADRVWTGHANGTITINVAEADHVARTRMREQMRERYRTLLGHFRHEVGHYYWAVLIDGSAEQSRFRELFGDERADYAKTMATYYKRGAPRGWEDTYVTPYASSHPWEDWAESFAHYLHMIDTLDTAADFGFELRGGLGAVASQARTSRQIAEAASTQSQSQFQSQQHAQDSAATAQPKGFGAERDFDALLDRFIRLTVAMNAVTRSMGTGDLYPFVLCNAAKSKLRFVHHVILRAVGEHESNQLALILEG